MDTVNEKYEINLDVGTLAVIIIIVVTTCSILMLLSLYCWNRSSSHTRIHCARCHQAIGVHGLPLPPQTVPPVHPSQLVNNFHHADKFQSTLPNNSPAFSGAPPSQPMPPANLPSIVINQPNDVKCGDSATFQRLGMKRPDSGIADDAKALETRALSSVQASPPEATTPGLEPLTPSPVLSGNQQIERRGRREQFKESDTVHNNLQQVRVVNFTSRQPPSFKTPGNALKAKRSSLKGSTTVQGRTVTTLQPSQLFLVGHDRSHDQPLLDASEMCRTAITTGDLKDLCENTGEVETSLTTPSNAILPPHTVPPSRSITITPANQSLSISVTQFQDQNQDNPSPLTSLCSTLTPTNHILLQQPVQDAVFADGEPSKPTIEKHDAKVVDRRSLISPHMAITEYEMNVTDRRSLAGGTAPLPATSELFITRREEEHNTSPAANVFLFNKSFDPSIPHQVEVNRQYQHPQSGATQDQLSKDRRLSHPPSKIPINEGYLEHNNSIKAERVNETGLSESQQKEKGVDRVHIRDTVVKPADEKSRTPTGDVSVVSPITVQDKSGGSDRLKRATQGLDKSVNNSGSKQKALPACYPNRPKTERQPAGSTGTYTKSKKDPNI